MRVFNQLLGNGGSALLEGAAKEVFENRTPDAHSVEAVMTIKSLVFNIDESSWKIFWKSINPDDIARLKAACAAYFLPCFIIDDYLSVGQKKLFRLQAYVVGNKGVVAAKTDCKSKISKESF